MQSLTDCVLVAFLAPTLAPTLAFPRGTFLGTSQVEALMGASNHHHSTAAQLKTLRKQLKVPLPHNTLPATTTTSGMPPQETQSQLAAAHSDHERMAREAATLRTTVQQLQLKQLQGRRQKGHAAKENKAPTGDKPPRHNTPPAVRKKIRVSDVSSCWHDVPA